MTGGDPRPWFLTEPRLTIVATAWLERDAAKGASQASSEHTARPTTPSAAADPRKVVVVHGRDNEARNALFDYLRALDLHPLTWEEMVAETKIATPDIHRVLESAFQAAQAVVVFTIYKRSIHRYVACRDAHGISQLVFR